MKKFLAALILPAAIFAAAAENPIYKMYSDEIMFSVSFNDTLEADMANGKGEVRRILTKTPVSYKPGMFGKAVFGVVPMYFSEGNVDTTVPGSVVAWAAPTWSQEVTKKEPGFSIFGVHAASKDQIYDLIFGKMPNQPWKKGHLNAYVQYPRLKKVTSCILWNQGMVYQWPAGQWHMFVVTWGNGTISYSVDGKKSAVSELREILAAKPQWFTIRADSFVVDELTILNKRLTDAEIAKLYQESLKAAKK
ncbi:MAG: LamG domain-containing protein [Lentisphaerae bacterium]|nr:LamG domain-containing protein [Lentisphaerota bacterium]